MVPRAWIGPALAVSCIVLLLVPVSIDNTSRAFHAWWDFAHVPAFACITCGLLESSRQLGGSRRLAMAGWASALVLVPSMEWLQGFSAGREQDLSDVIYGITGCVIGGLLYLGRCYGSTRPLAAFLAAGSMIFPAAIWHDDHRIDRLFPVLSTFDTALEPTRWTIKGCEVEQVRDGGWDVTIRGDHAYACLILADAPRDWSAHGGLGVDLLLYGDKPMTMTVVVDDAPGVQAHDNRFLQNATLQPGENAVLFDRRLLEVKISGQPMDLRAIRGLGLYFQAEAGRKLLLRRVYLTEPTNGNGLAASERRVRAKYMHQHRDQRDQTRRIPRKPRAA